MDTIATEVDTEDVQYMIYSTQYHRIKLKINDETEETAADKYREKITKDKSLTPIEKENEKTFWIQNKAKLIQRKDPLTEDDWKRSIDALRSEIFYRTHEEAIEEANKQKTLDDYPEKDSESSLTITTPNSSVKIDSKDREKLIEARDKLIKEKS